VPGTSRSEAQEAFFKNYERLKAERCGVDHQPQYRLAAQARPLADLNQFRLQCPLSGTERSRQGSIGLSVCPGTDFGALVRAI
jgi:hypothetical protein